MNEFLMMLKKISFSNKDTLYIIGDVIDRGPKPIELLKFIMNTKNIHLIMGNHEEMMLNCLLSPYLSPEERDDMKYCPNLQSSRALWILYNGGERTAEEYNRLSFKEQKSIYDYLCSLKKAELVQINGRKYALVHGGPEKDFIVKIENKTLASDVMWTRIEKTDFDKDLIAGYELIVGHTPTANYGTEYAGKIIAADYKYLIDCGCVFGGALGCLCLDNLKTYYIKSEQL
jgi:serine/threonine protein phosphatase 1